MNKARRIPSSFRDPSGFLFSKNGVLYRQINDVYKKNYNILIDSGLFKNLADKKLLLTHEEVRAHETLYNNTYKIIRPELVPFISYPYEWCFSQLKDAALLTLEIQRRSLEFGMSLKDCSAYNIQFKSGKPVFIDTLSFEEYKEGAPWVAYRQFCQHFLAPLALMSWRDVRLSRLLRLYIDGIPLDLTSSLLPLKTFYNFPILMHIHLHAKAQKRFEDKKIQTRQIKVSKLSLLGLVDGLKSSIEKLKWKAHGTEWANYYGDTNYSAAGIEHKKEIVSDFLEKVSPGDIWDIGANEGMFSRISTNKGMRTVSFDFDPVAVEKNYLKCVKDGESNILPLLLDLANPSPGIGWENKERMSIFERGPANTVVALALLHHLVISNNLPFGKIADFFSKICQWLIIEYIPKEDSQIQRLMSVRGDHFAEITKQNFEEKFLRHFMILQNSPVKDSCRIIYLMKNKKLA